LGFFATRVNQYAHRPRSSRSHELVNINDSRRFFEQAKGKTPVVVFIGPAFDPADFRPYYDGLDLPVMTLSPQGKSKEYGWNHPPHHVMRWYADEISSRLFENGLIPQPEKKCSNAQAVP
jgi:hypothetical protein